MSTHKRRSEKNETEKKKDVGRPWRSHHHHRPPPPTTANCVFSFVSCLAVALSLGRDVAGMGQVQSWSQSYSKVDDQPALISEVFAEVEQGFVGK